MAGRTRLAGRGERRNSLAARSIFTANGARIGRVLILLLADADIAAVGSQFAGGVAWCLADYASQIFNRALMNVFGQCIKRQLGIKVSKTVRRVHQT